jgi:hypothetical protein
MNRKERRAAIKTTKQKGDPQLVMFSIKAPPLGPGLSVIKTDLQAFDSVDYIDPDDCDKPLIARILEIDKDIIRAIYYPDETASIKGTPELFTIALAKSVKLWSQRLSPAQQPHFDRHGLHRLEINEVRGDCLAAEPPLSGCARRIEWFWTFNANNKMQLQTGRAWLSPIENLDMRESPTDSAPISAGIIEDEVVGHVV